MRQRRFLSPIAALVLCAATGAATESDKLLEMTDRWRAARAGVRPLESFLRPLVASDAHFVHDPDLALPHLSPEMRAQFAGLRPILPSELEEQFPQKA